MPRLYTLSLLVALATIVAGARNVDTAIAVPDTNNVYTDVSDTRQSVGLVLSGGGAKGIAHIGVIKALEENDIPIDYITGTSMGAIVGAMYAMGYTPEEMMDLMLSKPFSYWSTGTIDPRLNYYFLTDEPTPTILSVPVPTKKKTPADSVPASLINPLPMNWGFLELFAAYTAQCGGDFNKLFVPYRCVTSDAAAKHKVVMSHGNLADAVRASMSFPIVFQPITIDGTLMYDGGIYDNFPVDVMKQDFAPSIMIGVDVSAQTTGPQTSLMDQIENLVIQSSDYTLDPAEGIKIRVDLDKYALLDFPAAKAIYARGYEKAMSMMDSIKGRVHARIPDASRRLLRNVYKSKLPYVRFDKVNVTGGTPRQNHYIEYIFDRHKGDTLGLTDARNAYYRAITPGRLQNLFPQSEYNDSTGLFTLNLKAAPKDNFKVGFGGYVTSSTNSYIFLNAGYSTMSFNSVSLNLNGWIGQSYMAGMINARMTLRTHVPSALALQGVVSREKYYESDRLFYEDNMPTFIINTEYFGRLKYLLAAGSHARAELGVGYGHLRDSYYRSNSAIDYMRGRDRGIYNLGQAFARIEANTLSDMNLPVSGASYEAVAMGVMGHYSARYMLPDEYEYTKTKPKWLQLEMRTRNYFSTSRHFSLGVESDIMLSTRKLLPGYTASIVNAPAYHPTPSTYNSFNDALRANSFIAAGIVPVYKYSDALTARLGLHGFLPLRKIQENADNGTAYYGRWFSDPTFFGELSVAYKFPFNASVSAYCNYTSQPAHNWNVGITFGVFLTAPKFLR